MKNLMNNGLVLLFTGLIAISLAMWACGSRVAIDAGGTATVKHVLTIEFGVCDSLPDIDAKVECVSTLLEILKEAAAKKEAA